MALTRFYDPRTNRDGPVSGALIVMPIQFSVMATNVTAAHQFVLPAGMKLHITAASVYAVAVTSDPALTIGTSAAGTEIVAAVNITTNLGTLTIKTSAVTSGDRLDVRIVTDTGDALVGGSVTLFGYVSAPPDSEARR